MEAPETVADAVRYLESLGYTDTFSVDAAGAHCRVCGAVHQPERLTVIHTYRFEGPTDPADEAIVLGVACPECGGRAIIVSAYGPDADPALFEVLARLAG